MLHQRALPPELHVFTSGIAVTSGEGGHARKAQPNQVRASAAVHARYAGGGDDASDGNNAGDNAALNIARHHSMRPNAIASSDCSRLHPATLLTRVPHQAPQLRRKASSRSPQQNARVRLPPKNHMQQVCSQPSAGMPALR